MVVKVWSETRNEMRDIILNKDNEVIVLKVLKMLTPKEEKVLKLRYGLGNNEKHTLQKIGEMFNVTRNRIWQIEIKALRKLSHPKRRKLLESFIEF